VNGLARSQVKFAEPRAINPQVAVRALAYEVSRALRSFALPELGTTGNVVRYAAAPAVMACASAP
jgi:hypothetical protein